MDGGESTLFKSSPNVVMMVMTPLMQLHQTPTMTMMHVGYWVFILQHAVVCQPMTSPIQAGLSVRKGHSVPTAGIRLLRSLRVLTSDHWDILLLLFSQTCLGSFLWINVQKFQCNLLEISWLIMSPARFYTIHAIKYQMKHASILSSS